MASQLNVGDKAPDFTLPKTLTDKVTLSDLLQEKKVVLVFYIFDFAGDADSL
jgi:peroxiredoxin